MAIRNPSRAHRWAFVALLVGNLALAGGPFLVRHAGVGPISAGFWRVTLAIPFLWLIARLLKQPVHIPRRSLTMQGLIDQILQAGWFLLELINEILDLSLVESGNLSLVESGNQSLSVEPIALVSVLRECEAMIGPQAAKRGIHVSFAAPDGDYSVQADHRRMKQVLINLLSNAIKYNNAGGSVNVACVEATPQRVRISVTDTGIGLTAEQMTQLFQPFNRLGREASAEEGTGIGLVMTKRLVEMMGGEIGVQSSVGTGSVFWIEMNLIAMPWQS